MKPAAQNGSVDGITVQNKPAKASAAKSTSSTKALLLTMVLIPYIVYVSWSVFLIMILPDPNGRYDQLIPIGVVVAIGASALFVLLAGFLCYRILVSKKAPEVARVLGGVKVALLIIPGFLLSVAVAIIIPSEPQLRIVVTDPTDSRALVAPIAVTFSLESAAEILQRRGLKVQTIEWDFEGDGVKNQDTIEPNVTAFYEQRGLYQVAARMILSDGTVRRVRYGLSIPTAVFSVAPVHPVIDEPARFSVQHLDSKEDPIREVRWDFDGDGELDETSTEKNTAHTYVRTGPVTVKAEILYTNQTQISMEREILVESPKPLPFPVKITTQPEYLVSPEPFGVLFAIETEEPHEEAQWNFDDGETASGDRVGHTFKGKGVYRVTADVRASSGPTARVSVVVRVVNPLRVADLKFEGSHPVSGGGVKGEVPLELELTPRTSVPLVTFFWEAPRATVVEQTDTTLRATYRRPGSYNVTLIGTDPAGSVLRQPITVTVNPPTSIITIRMIPEGGVAPLKVRFDASETIIPGEEITGFEWLFGKNDTPRQGGAQIEHLYEKPGTYEVHLRTFTTTGKSYDATKTIVIRAPVLDACFTASRTKGSTPLGIRFTMACSTGNMKKIQWDFGDGATTDERNPIHVFETPGTYDVTLELEDDVGSISNETLTITADPS